MTKAITFYYIILKSSGGKFIWGELKLSLALSLSSVKEENREQEWVEIFYIRNFIIKIISFNKNWTARGSESLYSNTTKIYSNKYFH